MEDEKQSCENLVKRWREIEEKFSKVRKIIGGEFAKNNHISPKEYEEHREVIKKLRKECLELLSPSERLKINEKTELFRSRKNKDKEN